MRRPVFIAAIILILLAAAWLRTVWITSDPPTVANGWVGVVWHDEGAWVHNARNRALWGVWRTDNWNPIFLTPVFTGLEYAVFDTLGVGTWQARVVPIVSGLAAVMFLMAGLRALAGARSAAIGGALLATNYVFVMWNRAALMESTMTAFIVMSWAALALSERRALWGWIAGIAAILAWFTKASAAFYLAAIAIEIVSGGTRSLNRKHLIAGLVASGALIGAAFVLPHWSEYRFYNWQMSVVRKPDYSLHAFKDRLSWLPVVNDFFMWMWPVVAIAAVSLWGVISRWREARPAERLLVLWVVVGLIELAVHDSGNERRYVMFIPALIGLASLALGRGTFGVAPPSAQRARWLAAPLLLATAYLVAGSGVRVFFLNQIHSDALHPYREVVALSVSIALVVTAGCLARWRPLTRWLSAVRLPAVGVVGAIAIVVAIDLTHFARWASARRTANYEASIAVGRLLPPGTLVQGKLANGLALENRIRPIFIGHGFGNYDDRLQRDDVRYILTYVSPKIGYESQAGSDMIQELLDRSPRGRAIATFVVNETGPADRAELFDKAPAEPGSDPRARD
jgi:4-amino-4-deoxy-L-arabinose transferase-like glycosyltransferase